MLSLATSFDFFNGMGSGIVTDLVTIVDSSRDHFGFGRVIPEIECLGFGVWNFDHDVGITIDVVVVEIFWKFVFHDCLVLSVMKRSCKPRTYINSRLLLLIPN